METEDKNLNKNKVHKILTRSYSVYFLLFLIGIWLDLIFNLNFFDQSVSRPLGLIFLVIATVLIFSAQKTSRNLEKENITKETFYQGPYRYTRSPTHLGLSLLMLGFGLVTNTFFVFLFTFISFIVAKFFFLNKQEDILALKYGAPYLEYKKLVKF